MKNYLALDTSGTHMTVVVKYNGQYYKDYQPTCAMKHGSEFMTVIEKLLNQANVTVNDMDYFVCVVGAGSFTGIRIGVSAVKAFCDVTKKPFLAVTSFDVLAYNDICEKILATVDAKHGAYYVCGYNGKNIEIEPKFVSEDEFDEIKGYKIVSSTEIGKGEVYVDVVQGLINASEEKVGELDYNLDNLTPLYLRKSQAEEGR